MSYRINTLAKYYYYSIHQSRGVFIFHFSFFHDLTDSQAHTSLIFHFGARVAGAVLWTVLLLPKNMITPRISKLPSLLIFCSLFRDGHCHHSKKHAFWNRYLRHFSQYFYRKRINLVMGQIQVEYVGRYPTVNEAMYCTVLTVQTTSSSTLLSNIYLEKKTGHMHTSFTVQHMHDSIHFTGNLIGRGRGGGGGGGGGGGIAASPCSG